MATLRKDVTKYIETTNDLVVKMVYSMPEAYNKIDLWDELPATVQKDVKEAI